MGKDKGFDENLWGQALEGVDLSNIGSNKEPPRFDPKEIAETIEEGDQTKAELMKLGNQRMRQAHEQSTGERLRQREFHQSGWSMGIETPRGVIGLLNGGHFSGEILHLGIPKGVLEINDPETDRLITQTLGVQMSDPVKYVKALSYATFDQADSDSDKPVERDELGAFIGYFDEGVRKWTRFYGPLEPTGGRVWINITNFVPEAGIFPVIKDGQITEVLYGRRRGDMNIYTFPVNIYNKYAPEGPTTDSEAIQRFYDPFIDLASEITFRMGGPQAINVDFGFALVPEDLYREGYRDIKWLNGDLGDWTGRGNEVVRGSKGDSKVILMSHFPITPWKTILRAPAGKHASPKALSSFIKEDILWF